MEYGKPVVIMEPVKGGILADPIPEVKEILKKVNPDASFASWALRFATDLDNILAVLSGMSSLEQMDDNLRQMIPFKPLNEAERKAISQAQKALDAAKMIPCTACHYCTEGCPMNICIPEYFSIYNEDSREDMRKKGWTVNFTNYELLAREHGKASECIECGQCEGVCPQHLPIIENLKAVTQHYEHFYD